MIHAKTGASTMSRSVLIFTAAIAISGVTAARASVFDRFWPAAPANERIDNFPAPEHYEHRVDGSAYEANCREVDTETDEGYGVSRHEMRNVCRP